MQQKSLFAAGGFSVQEYEDLKEDAENKRGKLIEEQADLAALRAQVNPNKIKSLKAEADMLEDEIVFYKEQLRRTAMISPIAGEITTKDLDYLPGSLSQAWNNVRRGRGHAHGQNSDCRSRIRHR